MLENANLNELFYQAGTLMLVGMVFVYAFLMLMIFVINYIIAPLGAKFDHRHETEIPPQVIAAISAAIKQYRSK